MFVNDTPTAEGHDDPDARGCFVGHTQVENPVQGSHCHDGDIETGWAPRFSTILVGGNKVKVNEYDTEDVCDGRAAREDDEIEKNLGIAFGAGDGADNTTIDGQTLADYCAAQ